MEAAFSFFGAGRTGYQPSGTATLGAEPEAASPDFVCYAQTAEGYDGRRRSSQSLLDRAERRSFSQHQNQPSSEYISRRQGSGLSNATQFQLLLSVKDQRINGHTRLDVSRVSNVYSATVH